MRRTLTLFLAAFTAAAVSHGPELDRAAVETPERALARLVPRNARPALRAALEATACALAGGANLSNPKLALVDFSQPSTEPRLWVLDLERREVLYEELVAHGRNSGENLAVSFSNREGSHQSSLGLYLTGETYWGSNGLSLRLHGLDEGFNDNSLSRAIVMHGAPYVSEAFAARHGRLGRSWGCPAVRKEIAAELLPALAEGAALFVYAQQPDWLRESSLLSCDAPPRARRSLPPADLAD